MAAEPLCPPCPLWLNLVVPPRKPKAAPEKPSALFSSPEKRNVILCLLLVVATLALYNPVNHHPFVNYDDDRYVTENPPVHNGLGWDTIAWAFTSTEQGELASAYLVVARARLQPLSPEPDGTSLHQPADSHSQRGAVIPVVGIRNRSCWTEPVGVIAVCAPPYQRRVGGLGRRAQERPKHVFLSGGNWGLRMVRAEAELAALSGGSRVVRPRVDVQTHGHHVSLCAPAARLLAAGQDRGKPGQYAADSTIVAMQAQQAGEAMRSTAQFSAGVRKENAVVAYAMYLWKMIWPSQRYLLAGWL